MPLPANIIPTLTSSPAKTIEAAIGQVLEEKQVFSKKERAAQALENTGLSVEDLAVHLANLIFSAKDAVKRNAILDAFGLHGINLKAEDNGPTTPNIVFQINGDNVNLNQLFAPTRNLESNT
jgi:hypothetical protein